jgi:hypothetical protein
MTMTTSKPPIHEALSAVMADVRAVGKNDRNSSQGFNFRGIDAVVNAVGPALRDHGVIVLPTVLQHTYDTVTSSRGTLMGHVLVQVSYEFIGPAGDSLVCSVMGEAMDIGDKATPKAMSVAFRTALLQALALPTDEPDPDSESHERAQPAPKKKAKAAEPAASAEAVSALVDAFAAVDASEDLTLLVQKVAGMNLNDADAEILRAAYTTAKKRLEAP